MKRHLVKLSREHHDALVLAQRAKRAVPGGEAIILEVRNAFETEIERHFVAEESGLLPALATAGHREIVERTLSEHAMLREMVSALHSQKPESLVNFGELLASHVRFEERELFPLAESIFTPEILEEFDRKDSN